MKFRILVPAALALVLMGCNSGGGDQAVTAKPDSFEQKYSYALGKDIGASLARLPKEIDQAYMFRGMTDALAGGEGMMTEEEKMAVLTEFRQAIQTSQMEERQAQADGNKTAGDDYRKANAAKEGVDTTDSGLQIEVLKASDGAKPTADDTVSVHYVGTLIDGTEFDSSIKRDQPATFPLKGVIKGWTEGLQQMQVGGKYRLVIPPELAYGPAGAGDAIGPNATLIFEIELLGIEVKKAEEAEAKADEG